MQKVHRHKYRLIGATKYNFLYTCFGCHWRCTYPKHKMRYKLLGLIK